MKLKNSLSVVTDTDKTVEFYKKVLGLHVMIHKMSMMNL